MAGMVSQPISARDAALRQAHEFAKAQGGCSAASSCRRIRHQSPRDTQPSRRRVWVRHGRSVLALPGLPDGLRERSLIVAHRLSGAACLTGPSVLAVRGLLRAPPWDALPETMEPWVIYPYRVVIPARVLQRRDDGGATMLGVRIAQPHTVMLDLLRFLPESDARNLTYRASGTSEWAGFMRVWPPPPRTTSGCPGQSNCGPWPHWSPRGPPEAELLAQQLLSAAGLTEWRANYPVRIRGQRYVIDIAFPGHWWRWRSTGELSTATPGSTLIASVTTRWRGPAGAFCTSPGTDSCTNPRAWFAKSARHWRSPVRPHDR